MFDVLKWLIVIQLIGLVTLPIVNLMFPRLPDKGYCISKIMGILLIAFFSWILNVYHIFPSNAYSLWSILLCFVIVFIFFHFRNLFDIKKFCLKYWKNIVICEMFFLSTFFFWLFIRGMDPSISHTEQPMDIAFLNACYNSGFGNPNDLWFNGESINYYYFGYWIISVLGKLSFISSYIAYNFALVLIPALSSMAIFGFSFSLLKNHFISYKKIIFLAISSVLLICFMSNLEVLLEFMAYNGIGSKSFYDWIAIGNLNGPNNEIADSWVPKEFWWWFRSTRIINTFEFGIGIDYTIQEFPFFSFLLGDLHPHMMAIPFFILSLIVCWQWFLLPVNYFGFSTCKYKGLKKLDKFGYLYLLFTSLIFGTLGFINFWNFPTVISLLFIVIFFKLYKDNSYINLNLFIRSFIPVILIIGIVTLIFFPFYINFQSMITGIKPVNVTTRYIHFFIVWGIYLILTIPFVFHFFLRTKVLIEWFKILILSFFVWLIPFIIWAIISESDILYIMFRLFHVLPIGILISISFYNAIWIMKNKNNLALSFVMILIALSYFLLLGSELLFIGDYFDNRMNTIFKLYYQIWILFGLVSSYIIYYFWFTNKSNWVFIRISNRIIFSFFIVFSIISIYYAPAAINSKIDWNNSKLSFNGLQYLEDNEYKSIMFLISEADSSQVLLEAVGEWFDMGLISRSTGIPNIINWPGHQLQWRNDSNEIFQRQNHVKEIYQTQDINLTKNLISKYNVKYIYVGDRERKKYGESGLKKFDLFLEIIFQEGEIIIYKFNY